MQKQKHAPLSGVRRAIHDARLVRFTYDGKEYVVAPRELTRAGNGTFLVKALVCEGPLGGLRGIANFHYWRIRCLRIMDGEFRPQGPAGNQALAA